MQPALSLHVNEPEEWPEAIEQLLQCAQDRTVWLLHGALGAGKTTFVQAFCQYQGVHERVQSPSFSLINTYRDAQGGCIHHFDLYRLRSTAEVQGLGIEEYLKSGAHCLLEWPQHALPLLSTKYAYMHIADAQPQGRQVQLFLDCMPMLSTAQ